jgi:hypothetical protein
LPAADASAVQVEELQSAMAPDDRRFPKSVTEPDPSPTSASH